MSKIHELAKRASDLLGVEISVTATGRAHYHAEETDTHYWLSASDLRYAEDVASDPSTRDDAYSQWCASSGSEMSARYAARLTR